MSRCALARPRRGILERLASEGRSGQRTHLKRRAAAQRHRRDVRGRSGQARARGKRGEARDGLRRAHRPDHQRDRHLDQLRVSRPQGVRVGSLGRVARSTRRRLRARARPLIPSDQASVGVYARLEDGAPGDASKAPSGVTKSIRFFLVILMPIPKTRLRTVGLLIVRRRATWNLGSERSNRKS